MPCSYHVLRHALQLGYRRASVDLHLQSGLLTAQMLADTSREPAFVHLAERTAGSVSESRYGLLYAREPVITGGEELTIAEFIPSWITLGGANSVLADQLEALEVLQHADTASLERAFAEHIDLCGYRWDAWVLSLVNERLNRMRRPSGKREPARQGIHLGAFGWVEGLKPDTAVLQSPVLDAGQEAVFRRSGDAPLRRDPANGGHLLTPSLNHAVTAAVLRNGYLNNATPANPSSLAVDLSSARVRVALQFIEGIRNGQPLGALLGYQLERRMHDRHNEAETDRFIYQIRKAFPLAAKRISETVDTAAGNAPIEQVEANNVCDGLLLLEHVRRNAIKSYPWGKDLEPASPSQQTIIDDEVGALFDIHDAIADLAIAESVHQVTMGNADRAAAAMDAYGKSAFPPEPEVVSTPRSGVSLTHRIGLHLPVGAMTVPGATPRSSVEPAVDEWLATVLPPLSGIGVRVTARNSPPGSPTTDIDVTMNNLGLRPVDFLSMLDLNSEQAMNDLDDRIVNHVLTTGGLCPDASVLIRYTEPISGMTTAFEVAPLIASLRALIMDSRPLKPSDAAMQNEAVAAADSLVTVPMVQLNTAVTTVNQLRTDASALLAALDPLTNQAAPLATLVAQIDGTLATHIGTQLRAGICGVPLAGPGPAMRARREWFELVRSNAASVEQRWDLKLAECDALVAEALSPATSTLMKIQALERAERAVSTTYTVPIPPTPGPLHAIVTTKRGSLAAARLQVGAVREAAATAIAPMWAAWQATFAGRSAFDLAVEGTGEEERQLRLLVRDMHQQVAGLVDELSHRLTRANELIADAAAAAGERRAGALVAAAKALLGDGVQVIPRFGLTSDQRDEWQQAFDARSGLLTHLSAHHDFPVDDWLYGVARVRTKMHELETVIQLAGAFATTVPALAPIQLPFRAAEPWLGMELPAGFDASTAGDHLLYTASYAGGAFDKTDALFGGLLVDEWSEVIPAVRETAGLAFHYDRPSNEPPQTILLVTPSGADEQWTWEDLRMAIPETFELARRRAVEPHDLSATPLARFLPATLMAFTTHAISISSELRNADVIFAERASEDV